MAALDDSDQSARGQGCHAGCWGRNGALGRRERGCGSCQPLDVGRGQGVVAMTGLLIHASFGGLAARGGPLRNRSGQTL